jgi:hypothetical protein
MNIFQKYFILNKIKKISFSFNLLPYENLKIIYLGDKMENLKVTVKGEERLVELSDRNRTINIKTLHSNDILFYYIYKK